MRLHMALVLAAVACATPAGAQDTTGGRVDEKTLERATVKLFGNQRDVSGRLLALTEDSVSLLVASKRIVVPLETVKRVDVGGDPVANGAIIGGLVTGVWCAVICGQGLDSSDSLGGAVLGNAVFGMLIGAWIDGMNSNSRTVYRAPSRRSSDRVGPRPTVTFTFHF